MLWGEFPANPLQYAEALAQDAVSDSEQRAMCLLRSIIPAHLFNRYASTSMLPAIGQLTGTPYLIRRGETTISLNSMGEQVHAFCIHSSYKDSIPKTDDVIALWLMITGYESRFLDVANLSTPHATGEAFREITSQIIPALPDPDVSDPDPFHESDRHLFQTETETIVLPIDDLGCYEVEDIDAEILPSLEPIETIVISDENPLLAPRTRYRTPRDYPRVQTQRERITQLAYDVDILLAAQRLWEFESTGALPRPTLNNENKLITQGISTLCLYIDYVTDTARFKEHRFVDYDGPEGALRTPLMEWDSWRNIDDAVILGLLDAYIHRIHSAVMSANSSSDAEVAGQEAMRELPISRLTKCIMSAGVYQRLTKTSFLRPPLQYLDKHVIIDDRVDNVVLMFADAENLGAIPYFWGTIGQNDKCGIAILEPINVIAYYFYGGQLHHIGYEQGIDLIYGQFPDNNPAAMDYQQHRFVSQSTCTLQEAMPDMLEEMECVRL